MSRTVKLVVLAVILVVAAFVGQPSKPPTSDPSFSGQAATGSGGTRQTWGRMETLADHFARHGKDFGAGDADDYAAQAAAFLERARTTGLPAKRDADGSLRVFDRSTGAFGAYNSNGTTRTYFKPGKPGYFDRQPGVLVDLRTLR
jgi:pyocin large subunit-like protein